MEEIGFFALKEIAKVMQLTTQSEIKFVKFLEPFERYISECHTVKTENGNRLVWCSTRDRLVTYLNIVKGYCQEMNFYPFNPERFASENFCWSKDREITEKNFDVRNVFIARQAIKIGKQMARRMKKRNLEKSQ